MHRQIAVEGTVQGRPYALGSYVLVFLARDGERGHLQILDSTLPVSRTWSWSGVIPTHNFEDVDSSPLLEIAVWLTRTSEVGSGAFTIISEAHQVIERLD